MPLPETGGVIPLRLEERGHRHPSRLNEPRAEPPQHARLQLGAPGIAPRHQSVPRGGADRRAGMRIGENHPLRRDPIEIRRWNFSLRIKALHIAVAEVVAENEDDVGLRVGTDSRKTRPEPESKTRNNRRKKSTAIKSGQKTSTSATRLGPRVHTRSSVHKSHHIPLVRSRLIYLGQVFNMPVMKP